MRAFLRFLAPYEVWVKLAGCLVLFTVWVEACFVPGWLTRKFVDPFPQLHDRTRGRNVAVLFELLPERRGPEDLIVVFVGDSTVGGAAPDEDFMPWLVREQLEARFPARRVVMLDFTTIGLYAQDALLWIAKGFSVDPDLVIYAMSPRIVPSAPPTAWATSVGDLALEWDIVSRVGLGTVLDLIEPQTIGRTLVYSTWPPARLRTELARATIGAGVRHLPGRPGALLRSLVPDPVPPPPGAAPTSFYLWTRADFRLDVPSRSRRALDALFRLCAREGRCLLYHIPVNPGAPRGFEPPLLDDFVGWVEPRARAAGVPFRDFRSFGEPKNFRINLAMSPDAIHPTAEGHRAFAPVLAAAAAARLAELGR